MSDVPDPPMRYVLGFAEPAEPADAEAGDPTDEVPAKRHERLTVVVDDSDDGAQESGEAPSPE